MLKMLITFGGSVTDYSRYTDWTSVSVPESINVPATMTFSIVPLDSTFAIPPVMAYVQLWSSTKEKSVFSGFVSSFPVRQYLARGGPTAIDPTNLGDQPSARYGQLLQYNVTCTSDEFLLNSKAIPFIPAFVNRSQGDIMQTIADNLCPNFYDYSHMASGDLVPYMAYDPRTSWCELAKQMGDGSRYRYKARDKKLWYQPYGDQPMGIVYDERQRDSGFSPRDLTTTVMTTPLVNDITIIGDSEAGNNHVDYFLGDGFTGNFPLLHKVFRGASTVLAQESWTENALNTQQWYANDPGDNFDYSAGSLNVTNQPGSPSGAPVITLGNSYLQWQNGVELAGGIHLEGGEIIFEDYCDGFINALYTDDSFSLGSVIAGFYVLAQGGFGLSASGAFGIGMSGWYNGQAVGPYIVSQVNHSYVASMTVSAPVYTRFNQTYRTADGEEYGGGFTQMQGSITFTVQDYDIGAATGLFYQPNVYTNTISNVPLPPFALYALINQRRLNVSITNTLLAQMPMGGLYAVPATGTGGSWQRPTLGVFAGTVNITGTTATWVSGPHYDLTWAGQTITLGGPNSTNGIGGAPFNIASVQDANTLILSQAPGDGPNQAYVVTLTIGLLLPLVPGTSGVMSDPFTSPGYLGPVVPWSDPQSANILPVPQLLAQQSQLLVMGAGFQLQAAQITAGQNADILAFYAQALPAAGVPIALQSFETRAAVSRLQNQTSILQQQFIVGDDGLRSAIVSDLNPLPRTSEDCDSAALAFLQDRVNTAYNGTYSCTSLFFHGNDSDEQYWPTVGRFLNIHTPARGIIDQKMLVTALNISVIEPVSELLSFQFTFGTDMHLEKILKNFVDLAPVNVLTPSDTANPPNPRYTVNVDNSILPDLNNVGVDIFHIINNQITINITDAWFGLIEVRSLDTNWGRSLTRVVTQSQLTASIPGYSGQTFTVWEWNFYWTQLSQIPGPDPGLLFANDPVTNTYAVATYLAALAAAGFNEPVFYDRTLLALVRGPSFTMPRTQYDQVWFIRPVLLLPNSNTAITSRRSVVLRVRWPMPPSPPLFVSVNALVVQFNFNGDQRNIYGFELRWMYTAGPVVLVQRPVASYADLLIDLEQTALNAFPGNIQPSWTLQAFFFNAAWVYSQPLTLTEFVPLIKNAGTLANPGYYTINPSGGVVQIDLADGTPPTYNFLVVMTGVALTFPPPLFTGGNLSLGIEFNLFLLQDTTGGHGIELLTFQSGTAGSFASDTATRITIDGTPSTRTSLNFKKHGQVWELNSPSTTGAATS